jgi:putative ABC transport system substrate-binding protein
MDTLRLSGAVLFLLGLLAAPLVVEAQQAGRVWRIGLLQPFPNTPAVNYTQAVRQGLRDHGYVEGQNIVIEHRMSSVLKEHPALLSDLVSRNVDVIVTWSTPAVLAAKKATSAIPIVGISGDPVRTGLVASLARPGGNLTGLAILTDELELKNLQLLKEIAPGVTRVAVLWNPDNPVWVHALKRLQEAAPALGLKLQPLAVRDSRDLEAAFAAAIREKAGALVVFREAIFNPLRHDIVNFAAAHRLPAVYGAPVFIEIGGLLVYGANFLDMVRRTGGHVDKILKGAKPADLPIEQATKFEMVINLKTAKALGLTIPPSVLVRADQVIE